jgi:hypothetical protein
MRIAVVGAYVFAGLVVAAIAASVGPSVGFAERAASTAASGGTLITLSSPAGEHREQLTVIDPVTRALAVYHLDAESGLVELKSVRNIHYDLQMNEFNGTSPLPNEIRSLLGERQ